MLSGSKLSGSLNAVTNPQKFIGLYIAHENFSRQIESLSTKFVFSLSTQKPCIEGAMGIKYFSDLTCNLLIRKVLEKSQNAPKVPSPKAKKARKALSNLMFSSKSYARPSKIEALVKNSGIAAFQDARETTLKSYSDVRGTASHLNGFQQTMPDGIADDDILENPETHLRSTPVNEDRQNSASTAPVERKPYIPSYIHINYIDGTNNRQWSSQEFPLTEKLEDNNKNVFGIHSFRPNQREVINATMSGKDVFVLMPTGGGKSLTYQLPALICPGVTLVISPLVSLIQDQIMHLLQANIQAAYLSGSMKLTEQQEILRELSSEYCKYKLLYVTPEKLAK